jgi:hypothetical protein
VLFLVHFLHRRIYQRPCLGNYALQGKNPSVPFHPSSNLLGRKRGWRLLQIDACLCLISTCQIPSLRTSTHWRSMAMAAAAQTGRQFAGNAIHLIMMPSPANLFESREVLRFCQSLGEVTTFKHLKVSSIKHRCPS